MNEVTNTSLKPVTAQAFSSSKANVNREEKTSGNSSPVNSAPQTEKPEPVATTDTPRTPEQNTELRAAVAQINDFAQQVQRNIQFNLDEDSDRLVVTVIDRESEEVIRQIPDETVLNLARSLKDQQLQEQAQLAKPGSGPRVDPDVFKLIDAQA